MNPLILKQLSNDLRDGAKADIWYDAENYVDTHNEKLIQKTQTAMLNAANTLESYADNALSLIKLDAKNVELTTSNKLLNERLEKQVEIIDKAWVENQKLIKRNLTQADTIAQLQQENAKLRDQVNLDAQLGENAFNVITSLSDQVAHLKRQLPDY